jgi:anti-sigma factor ChrR (cupin superfamily)
MSFYPCCRDAMALLTEASEGALDGAERAKFAFHMGICPTCKRYRAQLDTVVTVLRNLAPAPPARTDVDAILDLLANAPPPDDDDEP